MPTIQIEESLHDALKETDLLSFQHKLAVEKQLTKIEHFDHVKDDELVSYGLSTPAVRRLRNALDRRKKAKRSKLFSKPKPSKIINAECTSPTSQPNSSSNATTSASSSTATPCLITRDEVQLMEKLGEGGFATVKRGIWQRSGSLVKMDVAVKVLTQMSEQAVEDLHAEISHMQKLKHQNVIQLYGIVFGEPTMLVIEFCDGGSLLDRLRNTKKSVLLVTKLLSYALQIASGMTYLENRNVIHRDLALRNILLAENEEVVKISDFGLTRSLEENERFYVMSPQKKVPFAWCPPESLRFRQFSHKSDCWAFGVLLWELYSYGEEPWVGYRAADVLKVTEQGEQLKKPKKCLQEIYDIMRMVWNLKPELRPKFSHLRNLLLDIKFMTAETRESFVSDDPDALELSVGDHVIIIAEEHAQKEWFGQSVNTRKFGKFPHSLVSVKSNRISDTPNPSNANISSPTVMAALSSSTNAYKSNKNKQISKPIPGSLIHTGHGDIDKDKCWGNVGHIDEIYLKNPVIRAPPVGSETKTHGVSFISSITALHDDFLAAPSANAKIRPVSENPIKLDFDPLNAWNAQTNSFQETKPIKLPEPISLNAWSTPTNTVHEPIKIPEQASLNAWDVSTNSTQGSIKIPDPAPLNAWQMPSSSIAPKTPPKPPPPIAANKPRSDSEQKSPFEINWNSAPAPITQSAISKYDKSTAVPRPTRMSPNITSESSDNQNIINHRRNQTQPIVLPSVVSKPTTTINTVQTPTPENDPFFVDPNLKNLTIKSKPAELPESIAWRQQTIASMDQHPRPQSARLNNTFTFTPKPAVPLDQNVLALLDPLLSNNAKAVQQQQHVVNKPAKIEPTMRPESAKTTQTNAVPRPQSTSQYNTAPSALNVLAFVSNKQNDQPKLTSLPQQSIPEPNQTRQARPTTSGWTYLPPTTLSTTTNKINQPNKVSIPTTNQSVGQSVAKPTQNGQQSNQPVASSSQAKPVQATPKTSSNYAPASSLLPPPSELAAPSKSSSATNGSLLPPPSQLLLSGLKNDALTTTEVKSKTSDSAYGSLTSNSSASRLTSTLLNDQFNAAKQQEQKTQQVFNIQQQNLPTYNANSSNNFFVPNQQQQQNVIITQNNQRMFYSSDGIPFLLPTTLEPKPTNTTQNQPTNQPIISLDDLDIDRMIENVKKRVDFASVDQCTKALRTNDYNVEKTVQSLKVEKLMEMGLCSDQNAAIRALTSHNWDVSETALQLVS